MGRSCVVGSSLGQARGMPTAIRDVAAAGANRDPPELPAKAGIQRPAPWILTFVRNAEVDGAVMFGGPFHGTATWGAFGKLGRRRGGQPRPSRIAREGGHPEACAVDPDFRQEFASRWRGHVRRALPWASHMGLFRRAGASPRGPTEALPNCPRWRASSSPASWILTFVRNAEVGGAPCEAGLSLGQPRGALSAGRTFAAGTNRNPSRIAREGGHPEACAVDPDFRQEFGGWWRCHVWRALPWDSHCGTFGDPGRRRGDQPKPVPNCPRRRASRGLRRGS